MKKRDLFALLSLMSTLVAEDQSRKDNLPMANFEQASDAYLEGYIQALIDMHYYEYKVIVAVKGRDVTLVNLPKNELLAKSIIAFVTDIPDVDSVSVKDKLSPSDEAMQLNYKDQPHIQGIWFPQQTILFPPLIADPRQPVNAVNYRFGDRVVGKNAAAVSLGDDFPIFRWRNIMRWQGDLQIGIEAGIWAVFRYDNHANENGCELVNTDYFVGMPLSYAFDKWSFRLRPYHISAHLGDEFLCDHPDFICRRKNPSFEAIDFFTSYQYSPGIRLYFGPGVVVHSDSTFHLKPLYVQYGTELRFGGRKFSFHRLYGTPFFAVNIDNWQQRDWNFDISAMLGYEWSKLQGVGRKFRLYIQYFNGHSFDGQFFNKSTSFGQLGFAWGF